MQTVQEVPVENQAANPTDNLGGVQARRKVGVEVVHSSDLASLFFRGPRPGRNFPIWYDNEAWARRVAEVGTLP